MADDDLQQALTQRARAQGMSVPEGLLAGGDMTVRPPTEQLDPRLISNILMKILAPNAQSLMSGAPPAPATDLPPGAGKVPSQEDPRPMAAGAEALNMIPAIGAGEVGPAIATRAAGAGSESLLGLKQYLIRLLSNTGMKNAGVGATAAAGVPVAAATAGPDDAIKNLQIQLRDAGYYAGPIDGNMGLGTRRAKEQFDANENKRLEQERTAAQREGAAAETRKADALIEETRRKAREEERKGEERKAGEERMRKIESDLPWYEKAFRSYAGPAGYLAGALGGAGTRGAVTKASNKISEAAASRAEGLVDKLPKSVSGRAAALNDFYRKGGGTEPFTATPGTSPGFAANPNVTPMSKLYQPNRVANVGTDLGIMGGFGAESAYMQTVMLPQAQEELRQAQEAASKDMNEVNIQRLQDAKDQVAFAEMMMNAGRSAAMMYPAAALKMKRAPTVPAMDKAEAARLDLEKYLRAASARSGRGMVPTTSVAAPQKIQNVVTPTTPAAAPVAAPATPHRAPVVAPVVAPRAMRPMPGAPGLTAAARHARLTPDEQMLIALTNALKAGKQ